MKSRLCLAGLLAAVLVWAAVPSAYAVDVGGDQSGTWTAANSPYVATGWVTVPAGQTLTIQPGVVIKFGYGGGLTVNGTLSARGTAAANITFTSNGDLTPGFWNGLYFAGSGTGTMEYCKVQYNGGWGGAGIWCQGTSSPTISRCEISYATVGIRVSDTATPVLSYNTIANCTDWAVNLTSWAAMPTFQGNTYRGNKYNAVRFDNATVPEGRQITWNHPGVGTPYSISGWPTIERNASLTLPAGLVVKFDYGAGMTVKGTLTSRGTAADPIWFTYVGDDSLAGDTNGNGPQAIGPGSWNRIGFEDNGTGVMEYCKVRYNGGWDGAGVRCTQSANPVISNTEIAKGIVGLRVSDRAAPTLTNLTIAQCTDWPVYLTTWSAMPTYQGLTLRNNRYFGVRFDNASVPENQQMTWRHPGAGIAYSVGGWPTVERGARLNLPAGLIVKFDYGAGMTIKGTLSASGTAAFPIIFTYVGDDSLAGGDTNGNGPEAIGPGSWNRIGFEDNGTGVMEYCMVRYNGGWDGAGVRCTQSANPTISNTEIAKGIVGLRVSDTAAPTLTNLTIAQCLDWPVHLTTWSVQPTFQGLTLRGNRYHGVRFDNATLPEGQQGTWTALGSGLAYSVGWVTVERGASLILPPGAILKFDYGAGMIVKGTLTARGTAASPIVFTYIGDDSLAGGDTNGNSPEAIGPGSWNRIGFEDNGTGVMEYCKVRYNGGWDGAGVRCTQSANPVISNCEIAFSGDGVRAEGNAAPVIGPNNIFERNTGFGVQNYSTATINARSNWWGDASGPQHATLNPSGQGQRVSDRVDFQPYLTQRPGSAVTVLPPTITSGPTASNVGQSGATITWTTDRSSSTVADYGTTAAYGSQATGADGTGHTVSLTGLAAGTTYHYRVRSATGAAATAQSGDYTFTTLTAPVVSTGPVVTRASAVPSPTAGASRVTVTATVTTSAPAAAGKVVADRDWVATGLDKGGTARAKVARVMALSLANDYLRLATDESAGYFDIDTADDRLLLYGSGNTSFAKVNIDGQLYKYGEGTGQFVQPPTSEGSSLVSSWKVGDILVTQRLSLVRSSGTGREDAAWIQYALSNQGSSVHQVGLYLEMDTMVGYNDAAPLSTSYGYAAVEQEFGSSTMPTFWQAFEEGPTQSRDRLVAQGTLIGSGAVPPDRFVVGPYSQLYNAEWSYVIGGQGYGDSAVGMWWNPQSLSPGSSRGVATFYGLGQGSVSSGVLSLNVSAPVELSAVAGGLSPNPFEVNALVTNAGSASAAGVTVTLELPAGLTLAAGETARQATNPATLSAGQTGQASWRVEATGGAAAATYSYTVRVSSTTAGVTANQLSRSITVPTVAAARYVAAAELFRGSDPGQGRGTAMAAVDGRYDEATEEVTAELEVSSWPTGTYALTVRGRDSDGVWGSGFITSLTVSGATTGPLAITSGPTVSNLTQTGATIAWTTDRTGSSSVSYGTTTAYGSTATGRDSTQHTVILTGLTAGTTYHYRVTSTPTGAATGTSSGDLTFTTLASQPTSGAEVILDLDPAEGDQARVSSSAAPGASFTIQVHASQVEQLMGFTVVLAFDPEAVAYDEFAAGSLIPGLVALSLPGEGSVEAGGVVLGTGRGNGNGLLGTLTFHALSGFTGQTAIRATAVRLRYSGGVEETLTLAQSELQIRGGLVGDFDGSGEVDFGDFFIFADGFGGTDPALDMDGSGEVDFGDFFIFADNFGAGRAKLLALAQELLGLPLVPVLHPNYPNPFNATTVIGYQVVEPSRVRLELFNLLGQPVRVLVDQGMPAGVHRVTWDGLDAAGQALTSGVYLCRLQAGGFAAQRRLMLLR